MPSDRVPATRTARRKDPPRHALAGYADATTADIPAVVVDALDHDSGACAASFTRVSARTAACAREQRAVAAVRRKCLHVLAREVELAALRMLTHR